MLGGKLRMLGTKRWVFAAAEGAQLYIRTSEIRSRQMYDTSTAHLIALFMGIHENHRNIAQGGQAMAISTGKGFHRAANP